MKHLNLIKQIIIILLFYSVSPPVLALSSSCEYTGPPEPAKGVLVIDQLRVMTMNVWGQTGPREGGSDTKCQARLDFIGREIANTTNPIFHIVGLTEVHPDYAVITCDGKALVKGIQINGEYTGKKARWGHPETHWHDYDGGTSLFSTSEFDWSPREKHVHQYPQDGLGTAHGFIFSTIRINSEVSIDVYVTHIHNDCDQQCRYNELSELAVGIHERSANSGFPVLVMGDFNIGGSNPTKMKCKGNKGYGDIMELLRNPRDLWLEANKANPDKNGSTYPTKDRRIDYIFTLTDPYFTNSPFQLTISKPDDVNLIKWKMPGYNIPAPTSTRPSRTVWKQGPFRVSDHAGIDAILEVRRRLDWATVLTVIY